MNNKINQRFKLIKQLPKQKEIGIGFFLIKDGIANFVFDNKILLSMDRVSIDFASSVGIELSGYERKGNGCIFQKWWLIYEQ